MRRAVVLSLFLQASIAAVNGERQSRQAHVTLGRNSSEMVVTWACWEGDKAHAGSSSVFMRAKSREKWVEFPSERVDQYTIEGDDFNAAYDSPYLHHATVAFNAEDEVDYEYRIEDDDELRSLKRVPSGGTRKYPMTIALLGDHGQTNFSAETVKEMSSSLSSSSTVTSRPEFTLLVGDLSYADGNGTRWDSWEVLVDPIFSSLPLMALPGNHEVETELSTGEAFRGYRARYPVGPQIADERFTPGQVDYHTYDFNNISYDFGASFYSFDVGPLKVIALNTYAASNESSLQKAWLERELSCVNSEETPWVIIGMHGPWYSTNEKHRPENEIATSQTKKNLEDVVAASGKVSFVFSGHVHAYERSHPVCKNTIGSGPTYVTIGDGGNREQLYDKWPFARDEEWSAFRNGTRYGFGTLEIINETHARWKWLPNNETGAEDEILLDQGKSHLECAGGRQLPPLPTFDCSADKVKTIEARARRDVTTPTPTAAEQPAAAPTTTPPQPEPTTPPAPTTMPALAPTTRPRYSPTSTISTKTPAPASSISTPAPVGNNSSLPPKKKKQAAAAVSPVEIVLAVVVALATILVSVCAVLAICHSYRAHTKRADHDAFFRRHASDFSIVGVEMDEFDSDDDEDDFDNNPTRSNVLV